MRLLLEILKIMVRVCSITKIEVVRSYRTKKLGLLVVSLHKRKGKIQESRMSHKSCNENRARTESWQNIDTGGPKTVSLTSDQNHVYLCGNPQCTGQTAPVPWCPFTWNPKQIKNKRKEGIDNNLIFKYFASSPAAFFPLRRNSNSNDKMSFSLFLLSAT